MKKKISPKNRDYYESIVPEIDNLKKNGLINSYIGNKGYSIYKISLNDKIIEFIKKELTVKPFMQSSLVEPNSFPIYLESDKKIYVPRFWGINIFGNPKTLKISYGKAINLDFNGNLRDYQTNVLNAYLKAINFEEKEENNVGNSSALIELWTGAGKCVGIDTPIMMYNGDIKMVQDIKVGDQLMGDDSTPRNVLSLARGREMMYDIIPTKGDKYTVNESHILSLKMSSNYNNKKYNHLKKNDIYDVSLLEYLNLPKGFKHILKGYRVGVEFTPKDVDIEPYALGYWLGDGTSSNANITTEEACVVEYFTNYVEKIGCEIRNFKDSLTTRNSLHYSISGKKIDSNKRQNNKLLNMLKNYNLLLNKHIPKIYKCNSRQVRLELLAGIIDSDGCESHGGYDIIQKNETLLDDIIYVARSLGFAAYKKVCKKSCMYKGEKKEGVYYRTNIHGKGLEDIPVKCERKKVEPRRQIKDALNTGIKVEKREIDNYYGFELDGNRRYLLGDYTVTHNTVLALKIVEVIKKKTIIFVHKTFLKNQWIERIKEYLPNAKIGCIQGQVIDIEGKDIVIAMIQSISMKSYPDSLFDDFGLSIYDECHHISSEVFSNCLRKCTTLYGLGLSATMNRKDGLTNVFKMYLGDICYKNKSEQIQFDVLVKAIDYNVYDDDEYNEVARDYRGNVKHTTMLSKVSNFNYRTDFIVNVIENELKINNNQQILLLAHQRKFLNYLFKAIEYKNLGTVGYYIGGMKEADLKASEKNQIILATYQMAAEGLDIKTLTSLILATPKSDIVQSVGRILREKHSNPLIIDIIDQHDCFINQFAKRKAFYNEKNYKIIRTNNERYIDYIKYIKKGEEFDEEEIWKEVVVKSKKSKENKCLIKI
jgi:superfamily II DNA or RNA helicase